MRAMDQGRQGRDQMDAVVMSDVRRERRPSPASCAGLQSRQFPAHFGDAGADQDWSLTSLKEKLIKIGAKIVICGRPSMASTFLALRTIWSAAVICPASVGAEHMSAGPDEVRRPGSLSATRAFR